MPKKYQWEIASNDKFEAIYSMLYNSELRNKWGLDDVRRRVVTPLSLGQLVTFVDDSGTLCGFLTLGFLDDNAAKHQVTDGVKDSDWQSGDQLWVIDFVAVDGGGMQMLRTITKDVKHNKHQSAKYFRLKYKKLKEVRLS